MDVAFLCYHAIKMSHMSGVLSCISSGHPCQVEGRLLEYARLFSREFVWDGSVVDACCSDQLTCDNISITISA